MPGQQLNVNLCTHTQWVPSMHPNLRGSFFLPQRSGTVFWNWTRCCDSVELITGLIYHLLCLSVLSSHSFSLSLSLLLSSMSCSGSRRCTKTLWAFVSVTWRPATPSWPMSRLTSNQVRDPYRETDELCAFGFQRGGCVRYEYIFSRKIGILQIDELV